jgi:hypothetical protein
MTGLLRLQIVDVSIIGGTHCYNSGNRGYCMALLFMAKCGRLRCGGLDIVEGLVKTVDVFEKLFRGARRGGDMWV